VNVFLFFSPSLPRVSAPLDFCRTQKQQTPTFCPKMYSFFIYHGFRYNARCLPRFFSQLSRLALTTIPINKTLVKHPRPAIFNRFWHSLSAFRQPFASTGRSSQAMIIQIDHPSSNFLVLRTQTLEDIFFPPDVQGACPGGAMLTRMPLSSLPSEPPLNRNKLPLFFPYHERMYFVVCQRTTSSFSLVNDRRPTGQYDREALSHFLSL